MLVEDIEQGLRRGGADLADRTRSVAAPLELFFVLQRHWVGDDRGGLACLAEQEGERAAVEALEPVRGLELEALQCRDMTFDGSLRVPAEPLAIRGARVGCE